MAEIRLKLLGGFQVMSDGQELTEVLAHSPKGIQLMQYLILKSGKMDTTAGLMRVLWPESEATRPESALKTLVSRLRLLLSQVSPALSACLKTVRGGYQWETQEGVSVDVEEFLALAERLHGGISLNAESQTSFHRMMAFYGGRLLSNQEQPEWMQHAAEKLHRLYLDVVLEELQRLEDAQRDEDVIAVCRLALDADPLNEGLHGRLMKALLNAKREGDAVRQYDHAQALRQIPGSGAEVLDAYYARLLQTERNLEKDLDDLCDELCSMEELPGAVECDRDVFAEIFRLVQRSLRRTPGVVTVAVVQLECGDGSAMQTHRALGSLVGTMTRLLRSGDIVTRLNATEIAMMLPHAADRDFAGIADRIKRSFYQQYPAGCALTFAARQLRPAEVSAAQRRIKD